MKFLLSLAALVLLAGLTIPAYASHNASPDLDIATNGTHFIFNQYIDDNLYGNEMWDYEGNQLLSTGTLRIDDTNSGKWHKLPPQEPGKYHWDWYMTPARQHALDSITFTIPEPTPEPTPEPPMTNSTIVIPYGTIIAQNGTATPDNLERFNPKNTTVNIGDIITFKNLDSEGIHTFTSGTVDGFAANADGIFDSGIMQFGDTWTWEGALFPTEIDYYCILHVWEQGHISIVDSYTDPEVEDPDPSSPPPSSGGGGGSTPQREHQNLSSKQIYEMLASLFLELSFR